MDFLWPRFLLLLVLIPLIVIVYLWTLRRRRKFAVRYSSLALVREAIPGTTQLRRHLPLGLFLLGLSSLVVALARPTMAVVVPSGKATIMLSLDVSLSMCSTDIPPNRLKAAEAAVLNFIDRQNPHTLIGIVEFAGFAEIVQPPTSNAALLRDAVTNLMPARRTAIGSGILKALDGIAEVNTDILPSEANPTPQAQSAAPPDGAFAPDIIVLLSDGASNSGPDPLAAAQQAVERGVKIYTIGYGTPNGSVMNCGDPSFGPLFSGGGGVGGGGFGRYRRGLDEETLKGIAEMTGGEYYSAESAGELQNIFKQLPTNLITTQEHSEISVVFTTIGLMLSALAIGLSMLWHPLP